ncbi:radical SAM protein, partial [Aduncisulcus paluster]
DDIGEILKLAVSYAPGVRGVHFQPVSYFGRYPAPPSDDMRITLPEIMTALEEQSDQLVHRDDFMPPGCEHSLCSFHSNYLVMEDGSLKKLSAKKKVAAPPNRLPKVQINPRLSCVVNGLHRKKPANAKNRRMTLTAF